MDTLELWALLQNLSVSLYVELPEKLSQTINSSQMLSVSQSLSLSSALFIAYAVAFRFNKKGCFIAAFILCEIYVNMVQLPTGYEYRFYLGCGFIYSLLYWLLTIDNAKLKTKLACGIIILFELGMCGDAIFNSDVETYIYTNYEYITLAAHIYLISTLFSWSQARRCLGGYSRAIYAKLRYSDVIAYICYNNKIYTN